jgi:2-beta-glucuronyltransferase
MGPFGEPVKAANVHWYGLMPFADTIPFVKYADVGLNCMTRGTITDSLKIMQYTYCSLPIVASSLNRCDKPHMFFYDMGDDKSIHRAIQDALVFDRARVPRAAVRAWDALVDELLGH